MQSLTNKKQYSFTIVKEKTFITKMLSCPTQIVYLQNEKCAIFYKNKFILVDLNKERNHKEQVFDIPKGRQFLMTIGEQMCFTLQHNVTICYQLTNLKSKSFHYNKSLGKSWKQNITIFNYSNKAFIQLKGCTPSMYHELAKLKQIYFLNTINDESKILQKANDIDSVYLKIGKTERTVYNLVTQQRSVIVIPEIEDLNKGQIVQLYLLQSPKSIFALATNNSIIIGFLTLGKQGKSKFLFSYKYYETVSFYMLNPIESILIFTISQKQNSNLPKKQSKTIIFNYKLQKIVLQKQSRLLHASAISRNLDHILQCVPNNDNSKYHSLVDYGVVASNNKIYMHLFKKSLLPSQYGSDLIRYVLKVI